MKCGRAPHFQSGAGGTVLPAASIRRFPALSDPGKSLCSAGMRSLRGRSQHGEAEVTLQHLEGVPAFCRGETEAAAVRGAGMGLSHPSATLIREGPAGFGMGRTLCPTCDAPLFWGWGWLRLLAVPSRIESWHEAPRMGMALAGGEWWARGSNRQVQGPEHLVLSPGWRKPWLWKKSPGMTLGHLMPGHSDISGLFFHVFPSPPS